jgi:hypothetical protein
MAGEIHSKLAVVKLDTAGNVLTEISSYCNSCETPNELDEAEVTTFGNTRRRYIAGFASGNVTLGGPWSRALDDHMAALRAAFEAGTLIGGVNTASFEYGPEGVAAGDKKHSGEIVMLSYSGAKAAIDNALEWEAEFRIDSWTVGTY